MLEIAPKQIPTKIATAPLFMFVIFSSPPIRLAEVFPTDAYTAPTTLDAQQQTVILEFTKNAVGEIRQRQEDEDHWFNYKFILIGGLLGAFLARFAVGSDKNGDPEAQLGKIINSSAACCALAFATIVALTIDIHVRLSYYIIIQLGSWIAHFAEPALILGKPNGFVPWETFLRETDSMHRDAFYSFANWPPLQLPTSIIYVIYLGVLQEVSLRGSEKYAPLMLVAFILVQVSLLIFTWTAHTAPGKFEAQLIPSVDYWIPGNKSGFIFALPWALNTWCSSPYLCHLCRRYRSSQNGEASSNAGWYAGA